MKLKFWKQRVENIKHTNTKQKKSGIALSIFDKREFRQSNIELKRLMNYY